MMRESGMGEAWNLCASGIGAVHIVIVVSVETLAFGLDTVRFLF